MGLLVLAEGVEVVIEIEAGAETADAVVGHEAPVGVVEVSDATGTAAEDIEADAAMKLDTTGIATKPGHVAGAATGLELVVGAADAAAGLWFEAAATAASLSLD